MGLTPEVGVWIEGVGEVDMIILDFIVIEVDGWAFHSSKEQREKDLKRDRELLRRGYVVLRFTYDDVMNGGFAREVPESVKAIRGLVPHAEAEGDSRGRRELATSPTSCADYTCHTMASDGHLDATHYAYPKMSHVIPPPLFQLLNPHH